VSRTSDGMYKLTGEETPWYENLIYDETFHKQVGENVYVFTAIFAPSGLTTPIIHEWQHFDEAARKCNTESRVTFSILGGRDGGYRGYSQKYGVTEGKWRVNVLTQYGTLIGRVSFNVEYASSTPTYAITEE